MLKILELPTQICHQKSCPSKAFLTTWTSSASNMTVSLSMVVNASQTLEMFTLGTSLIEGHHHAVRVQVVRVTQVRQTYSCQDLTVHIKYQ